MVGSYQDVTGENREDSKILIESVEKDSPAEKMGLKVGDIIVKNGSGDVFSSVENVQKYINENKGKEVTLIIQRKSEEIPFSGTPRTEIQEGQGALGISGLGEVVIVKYGFFQSLWKGFVEIKEMFISIGHLIKDCFMVKLRN